MYPITRPVTPWCSIRTRPNHERTAAAILEAKGYEQYVPVYKALRKWSDRKVYRELPLFPGYIFCRVDRSGRSSVTSTPGVISMIGFGGEPGEVSDSEIEAIERVLASGRYAEPHPFIREGQRVRIKNGPLKDIEGLLVQKKSNWQLVISIELLQRAVSVTLDRTEVTSL